MGKCEEIIHLEINCKAIKILAIIAKNFTNSDDLFFNVETRENGNEKSKIEKANLPRFRTGSESTFLKISLTTISNELSYYFSFLNINYIFFKPLNLYKNLVNNFKRI